MLQLIRNEATVNQFFRNTLKYWTYSVPNYLKKKVVSRWSVSGNFSTVLKEGLSFRYFSNCDDQIANSLYYDIEQYSEYHDLLLFSALAAKSSVILDIGGNTGVFSVVAALSQPKASVIAFEPYVINAQRFKKNIEINDIKNVVLEQVAIGSTQGMVNFSVPEVDRVCDVLSANPSFSENFYQDEMRFKQVPVEATTLDAYLQTKNITDVHLIKIDVESYEMEVFKGAKGMLEKNSPVILCEIFPDEERLEFFRDFLQPMGYLCYLIFPHGIVQVPQLVNNPDCRNYLFVKNPAAATYYSFSQMDSLVNDLIRKS